MKPIKYEDLFPDVKPDKSLIKKLTDTIKLSSKSNKDRYKSLEQRKQYIDESSKRKEVQIRQFNVEKEINVFSSEELNDLNNCISEKILKLKENECKQKPNFLDYSSDEIMRLVTLLEKVNYLYTSSFQR